MNKSDEEFFRHLHKQIGEYQKEKGQMTNRIIEQKRKEKQQLNNKQFKTK